MQTPHRWFGAGHSTASDSGKAGAEAAASAIGSRRPSVVFVFASGQHDLPALLLAVRSEAGPEATVVGATTLGELAFDGMSLGGVAVAALGGEGSPYAPPSVTSATSATGRPVPWRAVR